MIDYIVTISCVQNVVEEVDDEVSTDGDEIDDGGAFFFQV